MYKALIDNLIIVKIYRFFIRYIGLFIYLCYTIISTIYDLKSSVITRWT